MGIETLFNEKEESNGCRLRSEEYYEYRAQEVLCISDCLQEPFAKEAMILVSEDYFQLARAIAHIKESRAEIRNASGIIGSKSMGSVGS